MMIMHIDMNSYFATLEQQANPYLRGKPVGVAGKGRGERTVVAGSSIEAKKWGVKSGMSVWEAKRFCPRIIIIPADYSRYQDITRRLIKIFESYTPLVEIFSIDEAFLDFSHLRDITEKVGYVLEMAQEIKLKLKFEIGEWVTASIGIAENKLLAKLASEMHKPNGLTVIESVNTSKRQCLSGCSGVHFLIKQEALTRSKLDDLCGIGPRLLTRLNQLGIYTIQQLATFPLGHLKSEFGPHQANFLHQIGWGIDPSPVIPFQQAEEEKSFGHSYTLPADIQHWDEVKPVLLKLSEQVGRRMRERGFRGRLVHLWLRFGDLSSWGKQQKISRWINDGYEIYQIALKIMDKIQITRPIRAIGVSVSDLIKGLDTPRSLFSYKEKAEKLLHTVDEINNRFGEFSVFRAVILEAKTKIQNIPDGRNKRSFLPDV